MQITSSTVQQILAEIIATGARFDPAGTFVGLFTAINNRGVETDFSDLTLAPGTFATAVALSAWHTAYPRADGSWVADQPEKIFAAGSDADNCNAVGWYLASAATGGSLLAFGLLPSPRAIAFGGSPLILVPRLVVSPNGPWDASISWGG